MPTIKTILVARPRHSDELIPVQAGHHEVEIAGDADNALEGVRR
jgi:hypothetical protein